MKIVKTLEEITALPLGTKMYLPTKTKINWWFYAGVNPKSSTSVMLVTSGNIQVIEGIYLGKGANLNAYYLDYSDACQKLLENAQKNVETVKTIYIDNQ